MAVDNEEFDGWGGEELDTRDFARDIMGDLGEFICAVIDYIDTNSLRHRERVVSSLTNVGDRVLIFMKEADR